VYVHWSLLYVARSLLCVTITYLLPPVSPLAQVVDLFCHFICLFCVCSLVSFVCCKVSFVCLNSPAITCLPPATRFVARKGCGFVVYVHMSLLCMFTSLFRILHGLFSVLTGFVCLHTSTWQNARMHTNTYCCTFILVTFVGWQGLFVRVCGLHTLS